jgi:spermidine/putrescine transport system substrate-binding protein
MKKCISGLLTGLLVVIAVCGIAYSAAKPVLHVYTWADYIKPELVKRFEKEHNCKVVIDTFDSNEAMYAKIKAGASGYDIITPSSYMVSIMSKQGLIQKLNAALLPNIKYVDPDYLKFALDPTMNHSVPYMLTITGVAYLKNKVKDFNPTWAMFERTDLKGRMTMLNDMRETIGAALKFLGYSLNTTNDDQLNAAKEVLIRWKKNLAKFENEQYKTGLASGEFLLVHGYSGDIMQVQKENKDIEFAVPKEGTSFSCDDLVISKNAAQVKLAHQFINYLYEPTVSAENTEFISYLCPNTASYAKLSADLKNNPAIFFLKMQGSSKNEVIRDLGADNAKYVKIWDLVKAAD